MSDSWSTNLTIAIVGNCIALAIGWGIKHTATRKQIIENLNAIKFLQEPNSRQDNHAEFNASFLPLQAYFENLKLLKLQQKTLLLLGQYERAFFSNDLHINLKLKTEVDEIISGFEFGYFT